MLPELQRCQEAEDYFEALRVPFDPAALATRRVVVMRRFGELLVDLLDRHPGAVESLLRTLARAALQEAYASVRDAARARVESVRSCGGCALAGGCGTQGPGTPG